MAKVSIILPSYNHSRFLKKRLDSISSQTFTDWELIIIDDCSQDGSVDILKEFVSQNKEKIAQFIINDENSGSGYKSWKKAIELVESDYIWIAETDDYAAVEFLEEQVRILELGSNIALSFSASNYVNENGVFLYNSDKRTEDLLVGENDFGVFNFSDFIKRMPFNTYITNGSSVVFRKPNKKIPDEVFLFKQMSDQFLWTYLAKDRRFAFLNQKLNFFRRHEDSTTQKNVKKNNGDLYIEAANYLNFFNLNYKYEVFVEHYIKHFVWKRKTKVIDTRIIKKVNHVKRARRIYYSKLFQFIIKKAFDNNAK